MKSNNIGPRWEVIKIPKPDKWTMKELIEEGYRESTIRHKENRIGWMGLKSEGPTEEDILNQPIKMVTKGKYAGKYYIFRPNGKYVNGTHKLDRIYMIKDEEDDI